MNTKPTMNSIAPSYKNDVITPNHASFQFAISGKLPFRKRYFPSFFQKVLDEENNFNNKKRRCNKKSVRFEERIKVHHRHFTQEDLDSAWYAEGNYGAFENDCRDALDHADSLNGNLALIDHSKHCIRGLESLLIPEEFYLKRKRNRILVRVILQQQELDAKLGISDPGRLKDICEMISRQSNKWALELGALDSS
jgi:hypothetical protein